MGQNESFSNVQLETPESITQNLAGEKNLTALYKEAGKVLQKMERNFDVALKGESKDSFDGKLDTGNNEFELKAKELNAKAEKLADEIGTIGVACAWAKSKLGVGDSSVKNEELFALVDELLAVQDAAKQSVDNDFADDNIINNPENLPNPFTTPENKIFANAGLSDLRPKEVHEGSPEEQEKAKEDLAEWEKKNDWRKSE